MQYLLTHHNHPTADIIYSELAPSMPTLSKTTIYNTLKLLANHGAVTEMTIDKRNAHYDFDTVPHSHFMCRQCGKIIDMPPDDTAAEPGARYYNSRSEQNGIQFVIEETEGLIDVFEVDDDRRDIEDEKEQNREDQRTHQNGFA